MVAKKTTPKEIGETLGYIVEHMATKEDLAGVESRLDKRIDTLDAKIDRLDTKVTKFEENETDKRLQLEVRVAKIENHLGLDNKFPPNVASTRVVAAPAGQEWSADQTGGETKDRA